MIAVTANSLFTALADPEKSVNATEKRKKLRTLIGGTKANSPASVFDPLSALIAESVGYQIALLAGSECRP